MALLIGTSKLQACECCGSIEHRGGRVRSFACFHGQERLLDTDPTDAQGRTFADTMRNYGSHWFESEDRSGWYLRGGRLPICPMHYQEGDVDLS